MLFFYKDTAKGVEGNAIVAERIKTYFAESKIQTVAGFVVFSIVCFMARSYEEFWPLLIASISISLITLFRLHLIWRFSKHSEEKQYATWGQIQVLYAGLAGLAWALAFVPMLSRLPSEFQYLVIAVCSVSVASSVAEGFSFIWPSFAFSLALLTPLIAWLLMQEGSSYKILALLLMILFPMLLWQSSKRGKSFVQNIELRLHIENLVSELVIQRDLAEKANLQKTRFLAAASHDLRQPVFAALLFLDTLKYTAPSSQQSLLIGKLDQSIRVFSNQLERLLDISRFDAGLVKPQLKHVSLTDLFEWLDQTFASAAHEKGLRFMLHIPKDRNLKIQVDMGLLESVMLNLVSNAIKFTRNGGVLVGARIRSDHVLIQVWDTGIGIAEEHISRIFEEFYQVNNPQRNREAGLGLGLSIGKRAMDLLGSKVDCRSRQGRGSVFELKLPLALKDSESVQENEHMRLSTEPGLSVYAGKKIIVLEDDLLVKEALVSILCELGANVQQFDSAEAALAADNITTADFYIVDHAVGGGVAGPEFLESVQNQCEHRIRAVVLTGETSPEFMGGLTKQPWPILHKPVNLNILSAYL